MLLIDGGNTLIKWGVPATGFAADTVGAARWLHAGAVARGELAALAQAWHGLPVRRAIVSNVAGPVIEEALHAVLRDVFGTALQIDWFVAQPSLAGVRNSYRNPAQLGSDRFASAIGARALFPQRALIVATCGTATTVDAVTPDGVFLGGMILPGLGVMATSLALNTAQLPQIHSLHAPVMPFADNTADAIISGCIAAQAGAIERAVVTLRRQHEDVLCVLAGGAAALVASCLALPHATVDNLVLIGLHAATRQPDHTSC